MALEPHIRIIPLRDWRDDANCFGAPLDYFFDSEEHTLNGANTLPGRTLCAQCPVARECLLDALRANERMGMRGGYLAHERVHTMKRHDHDITAAITDFDDGIFYQP